MNIMISKRNISLLILLIFVVLIPVLLYASSKRQDIRGKAAPKENLIYNTPEITEITPNQAIIKYVTNVKTTTFIAYDTASSSFNGAVENQGRWRVEDKNQTAIHSHRLIGLTPSTTYYFIVSGFNPSTNSYINQSEILSFTTSSVNVDCNLTDFNKDGKTDLKDAGSLQKCLNASIDGDCKDFDLNRDGKIDTIDMSLLTNCFQ